MNEQLVSTQALSDRFNASLSKVSFTAQPLKEERLPFTISVVQSEEELRQAVSIRHAAYSRHLPELGEKLKLPELTDYEPDTFVLLARSRLDGTPLGTARIQVNSFRKLSVEQSVDLPARLQGQQLAEVTRLGVDGARVGRLVKLGLFKASYLFCQAYGIDWLVAAGRSPIDQQYAQLMFEDLFPERGFIPMQHAGDIPHRVMALHIDSAFSRWASVTHPMLRFFIHTSHPDICVAPRPVAHAGLHAAQREPNEAATLS